MTLRVLCRQRYARKETVDWWYLQSIVQKFRVLVAILASSWLLRRRTPSVLVDAGPM